MKQDIAKKILWKMNRVGLFIWIIVTVFNMGISLVVSFFESSEFAFGRFISIAIINIGIMVLGTLISMTAVMASQGLDYMVTVYLDRRVIFKTIMTSMLKIIALLMLLVTIVLGLNLHYGFSSLDEVFIFGIRGINIHAVSYVVFFIYLSIIGFLTVGYIMFITLLGKRFGWHYLVGTIYLTLALILLGFNEIRLFFMIGEQTPVVFGGILIVGILLTIINSRLIRKVEVKG